MRATRQGVRDLSAIRPVGPSRLVSSPAIVDGRPRIAVDTGVSSRDIERLEAAGFYVAVVAMDGERDDVWLARASLALVDIVVSGDREVANWARERKLIFVKLRGNWRTNVLSRVREEWRKWQAQGCP